MSIPQPPARARFPRIRWLAFMLLLQACAGLQAWAQEPSGASIVSLYRVAPGKHVDFLKWMAAREAVDKEAGVAATQWYAHRSGDSWDFVAIAPDIDDATSDKVDEMARERGLTAGPKAGIEFRTMVAWHTDTLADGPTTAAALAEAAER